MSVAELRALDLYERMNASFHFDSLPSDVMQHLVSLFRIRLSSCKDDSLADSSVPMQKYTVEELRDDAMQSWNEYQEGKCRPVDELFVELEQEHPWAFK